MRLEFFTNASRCVRSASTNSMDASGVGVLMCNWYWRSRKSGNPKAHDLDVRCCFSKNLEEASDYLVYSTLIELFSKQPVWMWLSNFAVCMVSAEHFFSKMDHKLHFTECTVQVYMQTWLSFYDIMFLKAHANHIFYHCSRRSNFSVQWGIGFLRFWRSVEQRTKAYLATVRFILLNGAIGGGVGWGGGGGWT